MYVYIMNTVLRSIPTLYLPCTVPHQRNRPAGLRLRRVDACSCLRPSRYTHLSALFFSSSPTPSPPSLSLASPFCLFSLLSALSISVFPSFYSSYLLLPVNSLRSLSPLCHRSAFW